MMKYSSKKPERRLRKSFLRRLQFTALILNFAIGFAAKYLKLAKVIPNPIWNFTIPGTLTLTLNSSLR